MKSKLFAFVQFCGTYLKKNPALWLLISALIVLAALALYFIPIPDVYELRDWVASFGLLSPLVFVVGYILLTQLPFPRSVWTISAGLLFPPLQAIVLVLSATGIAALLCLFWVRTLGRERIESVIQQRVQDPLYVHAVQQRISDKSFWGVTGLRMVPFIPFSFLNYVVGLTRISPINFVLATVIGSAPGSIITILTADTLATTGQSDTLWLTVFFALCGCAIILYESLLFRRAIQEYREALE